MNEGITIPTRWMTFSRTHKINDSCHKACVIHNPQPHRMRYWPLHWREDRGIFERLCPQHGVGHPDPDQFPYWSSTEQDWQQVHGCCGCCIGVSYDDE